MTTTRAHRIRFWTSAADRQALAARLGQDSVSHADVRRWAETHIDNSLDALRQEWYDQQKVGLP